MRYPDHVPYAVIVKASEGDVTAMNEILDRYDGYINTLSARKIDVGNGESHMTVDDDIRANLQIKLIAAVLNFDTE